MFVKVSVVRKLSLISYSTLLCFASLIKEIDIKERRTIFFTEASFRLKSTLSTKSSEFSLFLRGERRVVLISPWEEGNKCFREINILYGGGRRPKTLATRFYHRPFHLVMRHYHKINKASIINQMRLNLNLSLKQ